MAVTDLTELEILSRIYELKYGSKIRTASTTTGNIINDNEFSDTHTLDGVSSTQNENLNLHHKDLGKGQWFGKFTYVDGGDEYEGEYKVGKIHGKGRYACANGDTYEGEWKDDKMHGKGNYYFTYGNDEREW